MRYCLTEIPFRYLDPNLGLMFWVAVNSVPAQAARIAQLTPLAPVSLGTLNESVSLSDGTALVGVPDSDIGLFFSRRRTRELESNRGIRR